MSKRKAPAPEAEYYEQPGGDPNTPLAACCKNRTHKDRTPKVGSHKEAQR